MQRELFKFFPRLGLATLLERVNYVFSQTPIFKILLFYFLVFSCVKVGEKIADGSVNSVYAVSGKVF